MFMCVMCECVMRVMSASVCVVRRDQGAAAKMPLAGAHVDTSEVCASGVWVWRGGGDRGVCVAPRVWCEWAVRIS